jgi:hypothetical protein
MTSRDVGTSRQRATNGSDGRDGAGKSGSGRHALRASSSGVRAGGRGRGSDAFDGSSRGGGSGGNNFIGGYS